MAVIRAEDKPAAGTRSMTCRRTVVLDELFKHNRTEVFMLKRKLLMTAVALLAASGIATVQAEQGGAHGMSGSGTVTARVSDRNAERVDPSAVAGGVGINARARLSDEAAADHNVKMVFSLDTGNYVADVHIKVADSSGRPVIDGIAKGPWLYARLPAGTYTATATYRDETVEERVSIGRSGQRVAYFRWPASIEQKAMVSAVRPILGTGPQETQQTY
jgi:hypothetical protein